MAKYERFDELMWTEHDVQGDAYVGQSFKIGHTGTNAAHYLTSITIKAYREGTPGTITCGVYACDGVGKPTGAQLTTGSFNANAITESTDGENISIPLLPVALAAATQYCFYLVSAKSTPNILQVKSTDNANAGAKAPAPTQTGPYAPGAVTTGSMLTSEDAAVSWTTTVTETIYFIEYGDAIVFPQEVFISGYKTRYQKNQVVGYFPASGDLRSIVVDASGLVQTNANVSGAVVTISGQPVNISGAYIASGQHMQATVLAFVPGGALEELESDGDRRLAVSISGQPTNLATRLRPQPLLPVTSASGGEICGSGTTLKVIIKSLSGNKDVFIGSPYDAYRPYSGYGYLLSAEEAITVNIRNLNIIAACANNSGDRITVLGDTITAGWV